MTDAADFFNEPNEHAALDDPIRTALRDMILARNDATPDTSRSSWGRRRSRTRA